MKKVMCCVVSILLSGQAAAWSTWTEANKYAARRTVSEVMQLAPEKYQPPMPKAIAGVLGDLLNNKIMDSQTSSREMLIHSGKRELLLLALHWSCNKVGIGLPKKVSDNTWLMPILETGERLAADWAIAQFENSNRNE